MIRESDPTRYDRFARHLLHAMGIGSFAGLASVAACGGSVSVENSSATGSGGSGTSSGGQTTGGSGGAQTTGGTGGAATTSGPGVTAGTSSSSVTVGSGGGGGGWSCVTQVPPGATLVYACLDTKPATCEPADSANVLAALRAQLDVGSGGCGPTKVVQSVPCGPQPGVSECCYYALLEQVLCEGRPFTVGGVARTAAMTARPGWQAAGAPDLAPLDATTRRALAEAWGRDGLYEHASIASFARFALELLAVGAPAALVAGAQAAMGDEIRHAELCFGLASAYAGAPMGPGRLAMEGALGGRDDLASIAAATAREGCIGETLAALAAGAARDAAEDPAVRAALDGLAADEAAHAALAWRFVAWAVKEGGATVRAAVEAAFAEPAGDVGAEAWEGSADPAAMRAHGRLPASELRVLAARARAEVIGPCARAMLAATRRPEARPA